MDCNPAGSSVRGILQARKWNRLPCPSPGDLPNPGSKPKSPSLQEDSLQSEPPGKPKNIGVGSVSLLQRIFRTTSLTSPALAGGSFTTREPPENDSEITQSCPTLCDPRNLYSPWNSPGQILAWVAFPFFRGSSQSRDRMLLLLLRPKCVPQIH